MSWQSLHKANKSNILPVADVLQRKGVCRAEAESYTGSNINPFEQQADKSGFNFTDARLNHDFSTIPVKSMASLPIQAKFKIGQPNDKYEQEADRVAEQVMRMPDPQSSSGFTIAPLGQTIPAIQRQEEGSAEQDKLLDNTALSSEIPSPDLLSLRRPFLERSVSHLWDPSTALGVWFHGFNFFRQIGLNPSWAGKAANLTAPLAINAQLKHDNPVWWEISDREFQTSSIVGALPIFDFDANFGNWRFFPFIQKKTLGSEILSPSLACHGHDSGIFQSKAINLKGNWQDSKPTEQPIQTNSIRENASEGASGISSSIQSLQAGGQPLSNSERNFFEPRFGTDFSRVRVHHDAQAANLAKSVNARAFTYGNHVVFGSGEYRSDLAAGKRLLGHELTHVLQQRTVNFPAASIQRYREPSSVNFGVNDTATLKEKKFNPQPPDPFIANINVNFTTTKIVDGETIPMGTLAATYANNGASPMPADITGVGILGGFPSSGLTDKTTNNKVDRVEGWGYHHTGVPKASRVGSKWPENKYYKANEGGSASMSYALFFKGHIAIHIGSLDTGSLACVHVADDSIMQQINYHTRANVTKVTVSYSEEALEQPCCERYDATGRMVSNPCGGRDPSKCP
ncbi:eCIS core domain-containing protein [Methylomonas sp. MgM2]